MGAIAEAGLIGMAAAAPVPDPAGHPQRLHRWILAYEARVAALADDLDEAWLVRRFDESVAEAWRGAGHARRRTLLRAWIGRPRPTVAGLMRAANRVALLEAQDLHVVLRARALFARSTGLRRCVDGRLLDRVAASLGPRGAEILARLQRCPGAGREGEDEDITLFAAGSPEDWARDGLRRFAHDGVWTEPALRALAQVSLPPATGGLESTGEASATCGFVDLLPELIPETSWLFG